MSDLRDFGRIFREMVEPRAAPEPVQEAPTRCAPDVDRIRTDANLRSSPPARRAKRKRFAEGLRLVKAAQKAGLPVKRATIEGVDLEFGAPEAAPAEEPPRTSLFKAHAIPKMKVVL